MIDMSPDKWVVRYKSYYRVTKVDNITFSYNELAYKTVSDKESVRLSKENSVITSKINKSVDEMRKLVNEIEAVIEADKKKYAKEIINEEVKPGMPTHIVVTAWGLPDRKTISTKATGTSMIWYYDQRDASITFFDNKVYEILTIK